MKFFNKMFPDMALRHCAWICIVLLTANIALGLIFKSDYLILILPYISYALILCVITGSLIELLLLMPKLEKNQSALRMWPKIIPGQIGSPQFWSRYIWPFILCITLLLMFTGIKELIPKLNPFYADFIFMNTDLRLHGGQLPHEYLIPYINSEFLNWIDWIYPTLIPLCFIVFLSAAALKANPRVRYSFLVSFCLCWVVIGIFGALAGSSMGPCFFHIAISGDNTYSSLMAWIAQNNNGQLSSPHIQEYLLNLYLQDMAGIGGGISAMPSMHVAMPILMVWAGFKVKWWLGISAIIYLLLVMISTIVLGWHYAVDIYVSAIAASIIWLLVHRHAVKQKMA